MSEKSEKVICGCKCDIDKGVWASGTRKIPATNTDECKSRFSEFKPALAVARQVECNTLEEALLYVSNKFCTDKCTKLVFGNQIKAISNCKNSITFSSIS